MFSSRFSFSFFFGVMNAVFVMVLTLPLLYEMHEDQVDSYAELATVELKKHYSVLDDKVIRKLPKVPFLNDHKQH